MVEVVELPISPEHMTELQLHLLFSSREKHPEVLDGRPAAAIVKVYEVRAIGCPKDVSSVAISVKADVAHGAECLQPGLDRGKELPSGGLIGSLGFDR